MAYQSQFVRFRKLLRAALMLLLFSFFLTDALTAQGSRYEAGDVFRLAESDTASQQLIAAGEWIEIAGVAENDLFAAGSSIAITGLIGDDAFLAGESVNLSGIIGDMLLSASETLVMDGSVRGDVFAAGDELRLTENSVINGKLFIAGNEVQITGATVAGRTRIAANRVRLDGVFRDHVVIYSNDVEFGPDYRPLGDTKVVSTEELYRENMGNIPEQLILDVKRPSALPMLLFQTGLYLSMLVTGVVLIFLFKPVTADLHRFATERFWKNTGIGFLLVILTPLLLTLLLFPVITIPLAILICTLFTVSLYLSYLAVAMMLGLQFIQWFSKKTTELTYYWSLALGLVLIAIINNVPFIGPAFSILLLFFGTGSFWAYAVKRYYEPVITDV
ncbi:hypothetical protein [Rhodohalobacter mucosus]|uniref:Polymer-forming cytoskeletal protein n=1 Tax=Rhodohalobacter mucosus TaxID=2079485 RepID=A0A316TRR6_9BACT|nr:hypothetical protein [Rhodohalobacter mucosus]PWN06538.1 hypothetical protein DDZ15_08435 [Rhodohalobacter mucosus]